MRLTLNSIALGLLISISYVLPSTAGLIATYEEGAPKDKFTFFNDSECTISDSTLRLDLSESIAGLIFDTTDKGAGVEVFQPLQLVSGAQYLSSIPAVKDGDTSVEFKIEKLGPKQKLAFTIDVDDTAVGRQITVTDSEIVGGKVVLVRQASIHSASFEAGSELVLQLPKC